MTPAACTPSSTSQRAALALGETATAQSANGDAAESKEWVISTVDRAIYRGEVLKYVPDSHIVLRLASGEVKRFAWHQVQRVSTIASRTTFVPAPPRPSASPRPATSKGERTDALLPPPPMAPAQPKATQISPLPSAGSEGAAGAGSQVFPIPPEFEEDLGAYRDHLQRGQDAFKAQDYERALRAFQVADDEAGPVDVMAHLGIGQGVVSTGASDIWTRRRYSARAFGPSMTNWRLSKRAMRGWMKWGASLRAIRGIARRFRLAAQTVRGKTQKLNTVTCLTPGAPLPTQRPAPTSDAALAEDCQGIR